ncbi:putative manganese-dependent inorganic diphosphatase [Persicobacter diffluens]|uniref:inorganic diphosphatase n=1 Tax=Persicobacter diffluens TaxID=981 RepID=A0AAN4W3Q9_9BACT|nr:manganese-dependent inorganic pyrophosphatase [Persicobacter diffluens]
MKDQILVFGHKNPDTDTVCSALAYAALKQKLDINAKAVRLGEVNKETAFVLDHFKVEAPDFQDSVRPQLKDIKSGCTEVIKDNFTLKQALEVLTKANISSLPVVDESGKIETMLHVSDIANAYLEMSTMNIFQQFETTYENVAETVQGELINGSLPKGLISGKLLSLNNLNNGEGKDVVILELLKENIDKVKGQDIGLIIWCPINYEEEADLNGFDIPVLKVNNGFFKVFKLISQSVSVHSVMNRNPFYMFRTTDSVEYVEGLMKEADQTNFPVLDEEGHVFATIKNKDLQNIDRQKVILVDHNEKAQTIDGIETAEILEIVDHHKFGNFSTIEPLMIRAERVGCSSTILMDMYKENELLPEPAMAGLMLSAIISDTLLFKSPTCTQKDIDAAVELAKIAGVNAEQYGMEMLIAGASLGDKSPEDLINMDMKEFVMGEYKTALAQINTVDVKGILDNKDSYEKAIKEAIANKGYDLFVFVVTDILNNGSQGIVFGTATDLFERAFEVKLENDNVWLPGVVSRKKQLVPNLMAASN